MTTEVRSYILREAGAEGTAPGFHRGSGPPYRRRTVKKEEAFMNFDFSYLDIAFKNGSVITVNDKDEIVGDWSMLALDDETYERAIKGDTTESEFTMDTTEYVCFPGEYNGYLLNMSLNMEYKTLDNNLKLVDSFFARLKKYAENGIFFKRFCVNVFRRDQQAFYKNFGFRYVCDNKAFGTIYELYLEPYPTSPLFAKHTALKELYENKDH